MKRKRCLVKDCRGGSLAEFALAIPLLLIFILGTIDLLLSFWQWNMLMKSVERGARLAVVSDPVAGGLRNINTLITNAGDAYGVDAFQKITCDGSTASCAGVPGITFDAAALNTIVYGRGDSSCGGAVTLATIGMCDLFHALRPQNIIVEYRQTGLGFQGRPGGPVPSVTVRVQNVPFQFLFIDRLLGLGQFIMNNSGVTLTGEDLSTTGP